MRFADHVLENYVEPGSPWPPDTWAQAPTDPARAAVGPAAEPFHRHCARQLCDAYAATSAPPPVFKVIEVLKNIQTQTYVKIDNILHPTERHADLCSEEMKRIKFVKESYSKYTSGEISRLQYVIMMGCEFDRSLVQEPNNFEESPGKLH